MLFGSLRLILVLAVCLGRSSSLRCRTNTLSKCQWNSTCLYRSQECDGNQRSTVRGGVYCVTLIDSIESLRVEQMGCMYDQEINKICQNQSQCLMKKTSGASTFLHCCCDKDLCNVNLNLSNPEQEVEETSAAESSLRREPNCSGTTICRPLFVSALVSTCAVVVLLLIGLVLLVVRSRSSKCSCLGLVKGDESKADDQVRSRSKDSSTSPLLPPNEKSIDVSQLELSSKLLKQGRSSVVRTGFYERKLVAVKSFHSDPAKPNSVRSMFEHERDIYLLDKIEHPNIVKFYGYSIKDNDFHLLFDFADQGSLRDKLRSSKVRTQLELIQMLKQISEGVEYLHRDFRCQQVGSRSSIAHRDLKTENILVYSDGRLVVSDLAMATEINEKNLSGFDHQQIGTARYMSPEILAGTISNDFNSLLRCDVYSLGLVFWEVVSRCQLLEGSDHYQMPFEAQLAERNLSRNPSIDEMLQIINLEPPSNRPLIRGSWRNLTKINEILLTIEQCWHSIPEGRINSSLVAHRIRQIESN